MTQIWQPKPSKEAPSKEAGPLGWLYKNLFSTPLNSILTLLAVSFLFWAIPPLFQWAILDANWAGESRKACTAGSSGCAGACWVFIKVRFELFMYGFYPEAERWRINLVFLLLAFTSMPLFAAQFFTAKKRQVILAVLASAGIGLLHGLWWCLGSIVYFSLPIAFSLFSLQESVYPYAKQKEMISLLSAVLLAAVVFFLVKTTQSAGTATTLALSTFLLALPLFYCKRLSSNLWRWIVLATVYPCIAFLLLVGDNFGLSHVETHFWGGLFLTLLVAGTGMATATPIGILLALGRTSELPVVRLLCVSFIEFVRGVPLVSVLFMASVMFPLFLPEDITFNKLLRALLGVAFFYAAYIAEVIRGGLLAIPKGQFEAAEALGWAYWKKMGLIILPQTLRLVIPGLANNFLSLLKDTTLVAVIGLLDLLGVAKAALADAEWLGFSKEAYLFAGLVFWIFCFAISRYSNYLEKKYHAIYQS